MLTSVPQLSVKTFCRIISAAEGSDKGVMLQQLPEFETVHPDLQVWLPPSPNDDMAPQC